jgi:hypothetical protein
VLPWPLPKLPELETWLTRESVDGAVAWLSDAIRRHEAKPNLDDLQEAIRSAYQSVVLDAAIQRFEAKTLGANVCDLEVAYSWVSSFQKVVNKNTGYAVFQTPEGDGWDVFYDLREALRSYAALPRSEKTPEARRSLREQVEDVADRRWKSGRGERSLALPLRR